MVGEIQFKVCGVTRVQDAHAMAAAGADFLGFNFYSKSPRAISLETFKSMAEDLPDLTHVAILVSPDPGELEAYFAAGLSKVQIHFDWEVGIERIKAWSQAATPERLWLAPKMAPGKSFDPALLPLASGILWDAYKKDAYGGTGHTSDWGQFSELRTRYADHFWILAGGLGAANVADAVAASGARYLDFNSGVEQSPGIKDPRKIDAVRDALETMR